MWTSNSKSVSVAGLIFVRLSLWLACSLPALDVHTLISATSRSQHGPFSTTMAHKKWVYCWTHIPLCAFYFWPDLQGVSLSRSPTDVDMQTFRRPGVILHTPATRRGANYNASFNFFLKSSFVYIPLREFLRRTRYLEEIFIREARGWKLSGISHARRHPRLANSVFAEKNRIETWN